MIIDKASLILPKKGSDNMMYDVYVFDADKNQYVYIGKSCKSRLLLRYAYHNSPWTVEFY